VSGSLRGVVRATNYKTGAGTVRQVSLDLAGFDAVLAGISEGATKRDADPTFPRGPFRALAAAGLLALPVPDPVKPRSRRASFAEEWRVLRAVAKAEGSVGRIFDGHLNAVERLAVVAPEPLRTKELEAIAAGELLLGVWGADPIPGEGSPAHLVDTENGPVLEGVKTFCSGSTGLDRALVAVRGSDGAPPGPPILAYVDLADGVEVDRSWFRGSGMRSSESHRVVFRGARVLAVLGEAGELVREPYFARDAIRTAVTWAGIADLALDAALAILAAKSVGREPDDIVSLAAGNMLAAQSTMDRWLEYAAREADSDPEKSLAHFSTSLRVAVAESCQKILDEAAKACGSHPFAVANPLDRARRDLELFLLQHRLEPALVHAGRQVVAKHRPHP
jgi:alkylation response protein AidB-like acyl-CoA dehydrogenase